MLTNFETLDNKQNPEAKQS